MIQPVDSFTEEHHPRSRAGEAGLPGKALQEMHSLDGVSEGGRLVERTETEGRKTSKQRMYVTYTASLQSMQPWGTSGSSVWPQPTVWKSGDTWRQRGLLPLTLRGLIES